VIEPDRSGGPFALLTEGHDVAGSVRDAVLATAAQQGLRLSSIREVVPSLDDIYRRALKARGLAAARVAAA
jgi:hypothetical protein